MTQYTYHRPKRSGREIATDVVTELVVRPPFDFVRWSARGAGFAFGVIVIAKKFGVLPGKK